MRIPYAFNLTSTGTLEAKENEAQVVQIIFDYYLAGASLGKVVNMLYEKHIPSPTGKAKWTRAAVALIYSSIKNNEGLSCLCWNRTLEECGFGQEFRLLRTR